jgi:hypothetical protein
MIIFKNIIPGFIFLFTFESVIHCQEVTGLVSDAFDDEPLIGVSIIMKGTNIGGVTDEHGRYKINVDSLHKTLCYSFSNYSTKEIMINEKTTINVVLEKEPVKFEEVIFTDYIRKNKPVENGDIIRIVSTENKERIDTFRIGQDLETLKLHGDSLDALIPRIHRGEFSRDFEFECFRDFIFRKIEYPKVAKELYLEGKIVARFTVDTLGNFKDIELIRNIDYLGEETLNALKNVPKWIQAEMGESQMVRGRKYEMTYILPIKFRLEEIE